MMSDVLLRTWVAGASGHQEEQGQTVCPDLES